MKACFRSEYSELLLNEGSAFCLDSDDLTTSLSTQLEEASSKNYEKAIVLRRLLSSVQKKDILQFKVHFIMANNRQVSLETMARPRTFFLQLS